MKKKDITGKEIEVGNKVVFSTSASETDLEMGEVIKITPKGVTIRRFDRQSAFGRKGGFQNASELSETINKKILGENGTRVEVYIVEEKD